MAQTEILGFEITEQRHRRGAKLECWLLYRNGDQERLKAIAVDPPSWRDRLQGYTLGEKLKLAKRTLAAEAKEVMQIEADMTEQITRMERGLRPESPNG